MKERRRNIKNIIKVEKVLDNNPILILMFSHIPCYFLHLHVLQIALYSTNMHRSCSI